MPRLPFVTPNRPPTLGGLRASAATETVVPNRRASDAPDEQRFRFPADEVWEVSCCADEDAPASSSPERRAS